MPSVARLAELTATDRDAILAPLDAFSRARGFAWGPAPLSLVLRADGDEVLGGLIGELNWRWLRISVLAVAEEVRGGGWGRQLVEEAERIAVAAGCHSAWVDTFSFQSPGFYHRLGYRTFGELPDYPPGETRYFLAKQLVPPVPHPTEPSGGPG